MAVVRTTLHEGHSYLPNASFASTVKGFLGDASMYIRVEGEVLR